jgi:hypothetical protein
VKRCAAAPKMMSSKSCTGTFCRIESASDLGYSDRPFYVQLNVDGKCFIQDGRTVYSSQKGTVVEEECDKRIGKLWGPGTIK